MFKKMIFLLMLNSIHLIQSTSTVLLIVDVQRSFLDINYPYYIPNTGSDFLNAINQIRAQIKSEASASNDTYVEIFSQDCNRDYSKCLLEDKEIDIPEALLSKEDYEASHKISIHPFISGEDIDYKALRKIVPLNATRLIFRKAMESSEYSVFGNTYYNQNRYGKKEYSTLSRLLKFLNTKKVYVVGLAYQMCVLYTAADSAFLGYETQIILDGTRSFVVTKNRVGGARDESSMKAEQLSEDEKTTLHIANGLNYLPKSHLSVVNFDQKCRLDDYSCSSGMKNFNSSVIK